MQKDVCIVVPEPVFCPLFLVGASLGRVGCVMKFKFHDIDENTQRAMVHGGWLVKTYESICHDRGGSLDSGWDWRVAMVFVPDPCHLWHIED